MTVSKSLKILAGRGLVTRIEHEDDCRAKAIHLTTKGIALASELVPIVIDVDEEFFAALGNKKNILIEALNKLVKTSTG